MEVVMIDSTTAGPIVTVINEITKNVVIVLTAIAGVVSTILGYRYGKRVDK